MKYKEITVKPYQPRVYERESARPFAWGYALQVGPNK